MKFLFPLLLSNIGSRLTTISLDSDVVVEDEARLPRSNLFTLVLKSPGLRDVTGSQKHEIQTSSLIKSDVLFFLDTPASRRTTPEIRNQQWRPSEKRLGSEARRSS